MLLSYNRLSEYLPVAVEPQKLSRILTSLGLEVESDHPFSSIKGGLEGVTVGEVLSVEKHPDADKLKITKVNTGAETLQIVCGASNVAVGQKVLVATVGSTLYPNNGEPLTIKKAKIRSAESFGMICAEDELGLGDDHAGIMVLPAETLPGKPAAELFPNYNDHIFEIGLTPNRMDAMSYLGVARDVVAWLRHHDKLDAQVRVPNASDFKEGSGQPPHVEVRDTDACPRYSGVLINDVSVAESPTWLKDFLTAIGLKPINNIVDITNFVLHETGQPLHAFDADRIGGNTVIVRKAAAGEAFIALDGTEKKLTAEDLLIADETNGMCIAGVNGGLNSGVSNATKNIFLESACFSASRIRNTSLHHKLRTDAAARFEKGTDISGTLNVLKRAAQLIIETAGGRIGSAIVDVYPEPAEKTVIGLRYHYLKKLSGKNYHPDAVKNILTALGFEIEKESADELRVAVPFNKPDMKLPADIVEEIMRVDGLDNIEIPAVITIAPGKMQNAGERIFKEKFAERLAGAGFHEIFTNSISNSKYYSEAALSNAVRMLNSLSADLDIMRPAMLHNGLEAIAYNLNRKNTDLIFFEFGKTYSTSGPGSYDEVKHLALYATGSSRQGGWQEKSAGADEWFLKGMCENLLSAAGINDVTTSAIDIEGLDNAGSFALKDRMLGYFGSVSQSLLKQFGIKEKVFYADLLPAVIAEAGTGGAIEFSTVPKFPAVERDLAVIVDKSVSYAEIERNVKSLRNHALKSMTVFDIFENEKLGAGKVSVGVKFMFLDETKTLADAETDSMMQTIIRSLEKDLKATIRT